MSSESCPKWYDELNHSDWEKRFLAAKKASSEHARIEWENFSEEKRKCMSAKVVSLLDDPHSRVRAQIASAIANLKIQEGKDALVAALADPNEWVRVQVTEALGQVGDPELAQVVAGHLQDEQESHVKATLVKILGCIGDEKMLPVLALYLEDPDSRVRANCVEALSRLKLGKAELKESMLKLVNDPSNRVRANIALVLVSIGEGKGREILEEMLISSDEYMRASALYALGELNCSDDCGRIIHFFDDESWLVRKNAVRAIVKHGKKAGQVLSGALKSQNFQARLCALDAFGSIRDVSIRTAVIELLDDEVGEVRSKAEELLDILNGY
ncbi:MAG: HEAT repeat domain-containing protein [Candidatus Riflebacteria bacterium]|nr:HEAT repeat domain-containing protein [Candidatus Riflebacteria bacterium]